MYAQAEQYLLQWKHARRVSFFEVTAYLLILFVANVRRAK